VELPGASTLEEVGGDDDAKEGSGAGTGAGVELHDAEDKDADDDQDIQISRTTSNQAERGSMDYEMTSADNKAVSVAFAGYVLALSQIWNGATEEDNDGGPDYGSWTIGDQCKDVVVVCIFLLIGQFLLVLTHYIQDHLIFFKFSNVDNVLKRSRSSLENEGDSAVGIVEGAGFLAGGIIIGNAQYGWVNLENSNGWGESIGAMLLYWALGQVSTTLFILADMAIMKSARGVDTQMELKNGNYAVAIRLASDMVAVGICLGAPLGVSDSLVTFAAYCSLGLSLLIVFHFLIRATFVPRTGSNCCQVWWHGETFKDDWGAALVEGICTIALAKLFTTFLRSCNCYQKFVTA